MSKPLQVIKNSLSEHYNNFVIIAIDNENNLIWEYNNWMVGLMLIDRGKIAIEESIDGDNTEIDFVESD